MKRGLLGIDRGQWCDIHLLVGTVFTVPMPVHIFLHGQQVKCYVKSAFCSSETTGKRL